MRIHGLVLMVVFAFPVAVCAASFDCAKAKTSVEKMICADPALGKLDEQLAAAYHKTYTFIDAKYRPRLLKYQRDWLKGRVASETLKAAYSERLTELQNAVINVNSLTFLQLAGLNLPPYLLTELPGTTAYNNWVDQIWRESEADNSDQAQMTKCDTQLEKSQNQGGDQSTQPTIDDSCDGLNSTNRFYQVDFASRDLLSVHESLSISGWHTAHPSNQDTHTNWWLMKSGKIGVEEIFTKNDYLQVIQKWVKESYNYDIDIAKTGDELHPTISPQSWGLTSANLSITCQGYDVAIGRGSVDLDIPWTEFKNAVNPTLLKMLRAAPQIMDPRLALPRE